MKKVAIVLVMMFVGIISQAQESVVKISSLDAAFGMYEVSYERTFNEGINNIKPRGRSRKQGKWPNILTKGSMQYSLSFFSSKHDQTFGAGMTAVIDTNSNHDPGNLVSGTQVVADPLEHSVSRLATTTISGFGLGVEYRSYIKTYEQKIGDPPRGWYIAPFVNIQSKSIDAHVDFMGESLDEAMKYNFMVLDPDGRVLGMSSGERQANDNAKNNLRKVRGRVVKLRKPMAQTRGDRLIGMLPADNLAEEMTSEDSLSNWKNEDSKRYAEKLIKEYGQPDEVTETMLKWNSLGSFGKGERETYIIDESIPHAFPKPHRDYVYTVMNIKVPSDMLDTLGHVTGSIIYDGLKEEVTARCGSLYANAATLGFVRDMVEGKVTTDKDGAKKEYADRITKDPLPKTYDNKMNEDVSYMCGAECVQESYQEMIARIMSQRSMRWPNI